MNTGELDLAADEYLLDETDGEFYFYKEFSFS